MTLYDHQAESVRHASESSDSRLRNLAEYAIRYADEWVRRAHARRPGDVWLPSWSDDAMRVMLAEAKRDVP